MGKTPPTRLKKLTKEIESLTDLLSNMEEEEETGAASKRRFVKSAGDLILELSRQRERLSPVRFGSIDVTLGNPKSIAKFFTFNFINQPRKPLEEVVGERFYGAGVYAIYYVGRDVEAYRPLSKTETPIYVGKADPAEAYAETTEEQGDALYKRLKEHARNIEKTNLSLEDFTCRHVAIQSGMQAAVEHFMISFFKPIWNKEMKVCFGIGKHGDSAKTRGNKRSPWDTMHPGRKWAEDTSEDQKSRERVEGEIRFHFDANPPIPDLDSLRRSLSLG